MDSYYRGFFWPALGIDTKALAISFAFLHFFFSQQPPSPPPPEHEKDVIEFDSAFQYVLLALDSSS